MCGIVGILGTKPVALDIVEALRRLEYRGYDSAGIATIEDGHIERRRAPGKLRNLEDRLREAPLSGNSGIGHTRWATHGPPCDENSHPHLDQSGKIAVVHNGVIENYDSLKQRLIKAGHTFHSSTDTEVLAHLIGEHYAKFHAEKSESNPLTQAVCDALREVIGTYGVAVICTEQPDIMVGARRGSPLIIGIGESENFLTSDANAIVAHTRQVVFLNDYDVATLTRDRFDVISLGSDTAKVQISKLEFQAEDSQRGEYAHFMLKFNPPKRAVEPS